MKDSQLSDNLADTLCKYIKANNERFSTSKTPTGQPRVSISRRIMKDSQRGSRRRTCRDKYIKANNERFSTRSAMSGSAP